MFNKNLRNNLFMFDADTGSEGGTSSDVTSEPTIELKLDELSDEQLKIVKEKYGFVDDKELDNIIKNRHERWQQDLERAKMTDAERKKAEDNELKEENERLKAEKHQRERRDQAMTMLGNAKLPVTQELLDLVVRDSDEETQKQIDSLSSFYAKETTDAANAVRDEVKNGAYPSFKKPSSTGLTKEDIMAVEDDTKRIQLIAENPHLF